MNQYDFEDHNKLQFVAVIFLTKSHEVLYFQMHYIEFSNFPGFIFRHTEMLIS